MAKYTRMLTLILLSISSIFIVNSSTDSYQYPSGSLPCKQYNITYLDCSNRNLISIPPLLDEGNNTQRLDLSDNQLTAVHGAPFVQFVSLTNLSLNNNAIHIIAVTAFTGLFNLETLDLCDNKLVDLTEGVFHDLKQLQYLHLCNNHLNVIPDQAIAHLTSLVGLYMTESNFTHFHIGRGFENLTNLEDLSIIQITPIQVNLTRNTFTHLSKSPLKRLDLTFLPQNGHTIVDPAILEPLHHLRELTTTGIFEYQTFYLANFQLEKLRLGPIANWQSTASTNASLQSLSHMNSTLTDLTLSGCTLQIHNGMFVWMPQLETLTLLYLCITNLPDYAFLELDQLENLTLANNQFDHVPSNALQVFNKPATLTLMNLNDNHISNIDKDDFRAVPSLKFLYLERNHLWNLDFANQLPDLITLSVTVTDTGSNLTPIQSLHNVALAPVSANVLITPFHTVLCKLGPNLQRVILTKFTKFRLQILSEILGNSCPHLQELDISDCLQANTIQTKIILPSLQKLHASHNNLAFISHLGFIASTKLNYLDLSENEIELITSEDIPFLQHLQYLNLNRNNLISLDFIQNLPFLQTLKVAQNHIRHVPVLITHNTSLLSEIDLSGNTFECNCDIIQFTQWYQTDKTMWLLHTDTYKCSSPASKTDTGISEVHLDCRSRLGLHLGIGLTCGVLICIIVMLIVRFRWTIKYKLFLMINRKNIFHDEEDIELGRVVYVAYAEDSPQDEEWVINKLRPNMEDGQGHVNLLIKGRDFISGRPISDNIYEAIQQSRKTILVLSPKFVQNEWCYFEMQMAQMRLFDENLDIIILVLLESIPEHMYTLTLRQLLCRKQYLKWPADNLGQKLFWQRLQAEIQKPSEINRCYDV